MNQNKPKTILIVEDHFLIALQLIYILEDCNFPVSIITAVDGEEGLLKTRQYQPDLIITDLAMPRVDGLDMVKLIRQEQKYKFLPIIGISASDPKEIRTREFRLLCNGFLDKPFAHQEILKIVTSLLVPGGGNQYSAESFSSFPCYT